MENQTEEAILQIMQDLSISALKKALSEREAALTASEEKNRKLRLQLEEDKHAMQRIADLSKRVTSMKQGYSLLEDAPDIPASEKPLTVKNALLAALPVVARKQPKFSTSDVVKYWLRLPASERPAFDVARNRANISAYMRELSNENIIEIEEKGSGRKPWIYRLGNLALL